jgi:hypothetical protein
MKKLIYCLLISSFLFAENLIAQVTHKIASFSGSGYSWTVTSQAIGEAFETYVNSYLDQDYSFDNVTIDDANPTNPDSIAYLVISATGTQSEGTVTLGLILHKAAGQTEGVVDFFVGDTTYYYDVGGGNLLAEEIGWKCTSTGNPCGGCIRFRQGGHVVGCKCSADQTQYCAFEASGGGGSNFPGWLTSLIIALIGLF